MQTKIFISCSSKDTQAALTICDAIEARGNDCWLASRDVGPGQNFQEEIVHAIRSAPLMVLVFSANANNSSEIKKELALASQSSLAVIPVRIEDALPSGAFVYELATRQWIDLFGNWERAMQTLMSHIAAALPRQIPLPVPEPPQQQNAAATGAPITSPVPETLKSRSSHNFVTKSRTTCLVVGGLATLLIAGGSFWLRGSSPPQTTSTPLVTTSAPSKPAVVSSAAPPQGAPVPTAIDPAKLEADLWDSVKDTNDSAALKSYLKKYPSGLFAAAARAKIALTNTAGKLVVASPRSPQAASGAHEEASNTPVTNHPPEPAQSASPVPKVPEVQNRDAPQAPAPNSAPLSVTAAPTGIVSGTSQKFDYAMNLLAKAQYEDAKTQFLSYANANPGDQQLAPQAIYWAGNINFVQQNFQLAAKIFSEGILKYPASARAPDMTFKLGTALVAAGRTQEGCSILGALKARYPAASNATVVAAANALRASCKY